MTKPAGRRAEIGQERRARMRARLLAAAARVIAERGSGNTTVDDFIREASVARGTFYNHFRTREALLDALWASIGHDPFLDIQHACQSLADPAVRLTAFTRHVLHRAAAEPTWGWLVLALSSDDSTLNDDLRAFPRPDLAAGAQAGRFRFSSEADAADLVVGTVRAGLKALLEGGREPNYPENLCVMILLALGLNRIEANRITRLPLPEIAGTDAHREAPARAR
jgi:AcrR family transcriptional regulator